MTDDAGFSNPDTFGGPVHMPTMTRQAEDGVAYNRFHTTAMCSPTRAALLTGRNHNHVGAGQIAEFANDFDGYVGEIPRSAATIARVLSEYGYNNAAFGKWHNTPPSDIKPGGPYDQYPTSLGFRYFYGFIAGETSQYEPRLFENTNPIEPPHDPNYHLTEDMADRAQHPLSQTAAVVDAAPISTCGSCWSLEHSSQSGHVDALSGKADCSRSAPSLAHRPDVLMGATAA